MTRSRKSVDSSIVFPGEISRQTLNARVKRKQLRLVAPGIYTTDLHASLETIVNQHWHVVVGHLFPGAVITDRSAVTGSKVGGFLYVSHSRRARELVLPGLIVSARTGPGPLPGDIALPGGLHLASKARALSENTQPSRTRGTRPPRTLNHDELANWIDQLCRHDGEALLLQYRSEAEELAGPLSTPPERLNALSQLISAALGSRKSPTDNAALHARQTGKPFDQDRIRRLDLLASALRNAAPQSQASAITNTGGAFAIQAFYEAYFSNYIEGTIFTLPEAKALLYEDIVPVGRNADGHDVVGTYRLVADPTEMQRTATHADEFLLILQSRHATLMSGRPLANPGEFKTKPNQAGNTQFVDPALVAGTLIEGFSRLTNFDTAWERSVYISFLVSEIHPFTDGNGRMARIMMNAELVKGGQSKIVVPTGFRLDYLAALRRLSRHDDPTIYIKSMRFLHDYTQQINWSSHETALDDLTVTNAFEEASDSPILTLLRA